MSILTEGVNGQLNDIDLYDATRHSFELNYYLKYDIGTSNYFRKNPYLTKTIAALNSLSKFYLTWLEQLT